MPRDHAKQNVSILDTCNATTPITTGQVGFRKIIMPANVAAPSTYQKKSPISILGLLDGVFMGKYLGCAHFCLTSKMSHARRRASRFLRMKRPGRAHSGRAK